MKCKRCGTQMQRKKVDLHTFTYVCPKCKMMLKPKPKTDAETIKPETEIE